MRLQEIRLKRLHKKADKAINAYAMNNSLVNWQRLLLATKRYNKAYTKYHKRLREIIITRKFSVTWIDEANEIPKGFKGTEFHPTADTKDIKIINIKDLPINNSNK